MTRRKAIFIAFTGLVLLVVGTLSLPLFGRLTPTAVRTKSLANLKQIAWAACAYGEDKGTMPGSLGQLYPDYIDAPEIIYCTGAGAGGYRPKDAASAAGLIDAASIYRFWSRTDSSIFFYEQPGVWMDGSMAWCLIEKEDDGKWRITAISRGSSEEIENLLKPAIQSQLPTSG
jgi:hypothetical protein